MQERVKCAGPNAVAVVLQFFHHGQPEDRAKRSVKEHMDAN